MDRSSVVIVSPALAGANNGNWQTASRWARMLGESHHVRIVQRWPDALAQADAVMLALHARRSAAAIGAWSQQHPGRGLCVVLTGTDLYVDLGSDRSARQSVAMAQRLVVLQELGRDALPAEHRAKSRVIFQSVTARKELDKTKTSLGAVMVGHLREVKSPGTLFDAARLLRDHADIRIRHIGEAQEPGWAERARATEAACPGYRWLGGLPHGRTRDAIQRAHVLVHTSAAEGGAHVIMEAARSGTPVLASRIPGNVGMLGADYDGYFDHGDAAGLASLLLRCRADQANDPAHGTLARLREQCSLRAPLFEPLAERRALIQLVQDLHPP
ncbi:MAG: selenoneine biosynthesis selenosugar synthase SenB [Ramlibacter sp.]